MKYSNMTVAVLAGAIVAAAAGTGRASMLFGPGGSISGTPGNPQTGVNQLSFHNYENVFDSNGNRLPSGTMLAVGDYIVGIDNADQISPPGTTNGATFGTAGSPPGQGEVTGIFVQKVMGISGTTPGSIITLGTTDRMTFVDNLTNPGNPITINTGLAPGEMFRFWQDNGGPGGTPTNPFAAAGAGVTLASSFAAASNGTFLFSMGLGANPALGDPNPGYFYSIINNLNPANFSIDGYGGLNFVSIASGDNFGTVFDTSAITPTSVGFIIETTVTPNQATPTPWDFASHDPADVVLAVPEPASLGMMLVGGMALLRRRRRV